MRNFIDNFMWGGKLEEIMFGEFDMYGEFFYE